MVTSGIEKVDSPRLKTDNANDVEKLGRLTVMNSTIQLIPYQNLLIAFIPALVVIGVLHWWSCESGSAMYGLVRMVVQLLLIGYVLTFIFEAEYACIIVIVLAIMVLVASWIALRTVRNKRRGLYFKGLFAVFIGGGSVLLLVTQGVLALDPWYLPRYVIPLAGMIFAGVMNSVSLAAERVIAEIDRQPDYTAARDIAFKASLIPITNALFAVGLVALPGMMTGQILSGISPLIAVRYQIMVMCMSFGAAGIASALFLVLVRSDLAVDRVSKPKNNG